MSKQAFWVVMTLIGIVAAAATPLRAQQSSSSVGVVVPAAPTTLGPRLAPPFQPFTASLPQARSSNSLAAASGDHTIVISTLALVLGVIVLVLLIVR